MKPNTQVYHHAWNVHFYTVNHASKNDVWKYLTTELLLSNSLCYLDNHILCKPYSNHSSALLINRKCSYMTVHHPSKPLIIAAEGRLLLFLSNFASCLCCLSSFKAKCLPWIWQNWVHILKMTAPLPIHLFQKVHKCLCFDATNTLEPKSLAHLLLKITLVL